MSKRIIPAELHEMKEFSPLQVEVGSDFEDALRRFKSIVQKSKILSLYKEKQHYEKPSEKKRRKKREAAERRRLTDLRERQMASGEWENKQKNKEKKRKNRRSEYEEEL